MDCKFLTWNRHTRAANVSTYNILTSSCPPKNIRNSINLCCFDTYFFIKKSTRTIFFVIRMFYWFRRIRRFRLMFRRFFGQCILPFRNLFILLYNAFLPNMCQVVSVYVRPTTREFMKFFTIKKYKPKIQKKGLPKVQ